MMPMMTRTHPDDNYVDLNSSQGVDPNSSKGVDPSSSEGVDPMASESVDRMSSEAVDTMLTWTPAKLLSVLILNLSCGHTIRLLKSRMPVDFITSAIAAIKAIAAIAAIAPIPGHLAVECAISSKGGIICTVESLSSVRTLPVSGTLQLRAYEGLRFDSYLYLIVLENGIQIMFARGLITCCDEPVKTIDWLSLSPRWQKAYIVAASPNPQPHDDILYND